jgi:molybdopterin converting factor small subunit
MFKLISQTESIKVDTMKSLIYSDPGVGKTTLAFTTERPLLLDFDRGAQRASYRLDSVAIDSWEDVIEFQKSKMLIDFAPKTLINDTIGTMLDNYIAAYVKKENPKYAGAGGELSLRGYGAMLNIFIQYLNWAMSKKINLIFLAHSTEEKQGDKIKFIPHVTGGSYNIIRRTMDLIGFYECKDNKRVIDFSPKDTHIGKDCAEIGSINVPDHRSPEFRTFFQGITDRTLAKMNSLSEYQTEIMNKLYGFETQLTQLTIEKCNIFIEELKKETNSSIQAQMFELLRSHASKANISYDSKAKVFKNASN